MMNDSLLLLELHSPLTNHICLQNLGILMNLNFKKNGLEARQMEYSHIGKVANELFLPVAWMKNIMDM